MWIVANRQKFSSGGLQIRKGKENSRPSVTDSHAPDTGNKGLQGSKETGNNGVDGEESRNEQFGRCTGWQEPWLEVAARLCTVDDGLPGGLVRPRGWRVNALKAAGNAIVPQIAYELMKSILAVEGILPEKLR